MGLNPVSILSVQRRELRVDRAYLRLLPIEGGLIDAGPVDENRIGTVFIEPCAIVPEGLGVGRRCLGSSAYSRIPAQVGGAKR